jgi:hypothetical protein
MDSLFGSFSGLLSGVTDVWMSVAFILGTFSILALRPQQIHEPARFRKAQLLFGAYLLAMPIANLIVHLLTKEQAGNFLPRDEAGRRSVNAITTLTIHIGVIVSRGLFALSFLAALGSMMAPASEKASA